MLYAHIPSVRVCYKGSFVSGERQTDRSMAWADHEWKGKLCLQSQHEPFLLFGTITGWTTLTPTDQASDIHYCVIFSSYIQRSALSVTRTTQICSRSGLDTFPAVPALCNGSSRVLVIPWDLACHCWVHTDLKGCVPPLSAIAPTTQNQMHVKNDLACLTAAFCTRRCDGYIYSALTSIYVERVWIDSIQPRYDYENVLSFEKIAKISGITD